MKNYKTQATLKNCHRLFKNNNQENKKSTLITVIFAQVLIWLISWLIDKLLEKDPNYSTKLTSTDISFQD